jgi:Protein of unknown function (DUF1838)
MRKLKLLLVFFLLKSSISFAQNIPFNPDVFAKWVDMRVGDGQKPAWWYCFGEVYSYPDGKLLAKMEGIDVARLLKVSKDSVIQLNRKTFVYEDPQTGQVMYGERNGKPVQHIEYPYQKITYALRGGQLATWVTQGSGARIQTMGPGYKSTARKLGENLVFSSPVFLQFETPRGKYEAFENYDFFVAPAAKNTKDKYQLTWNRYGDLPPFLGGGKGVIQLVCFRLDTFDDIPETLRKHIQEKAPLWMNPPKSLTEIEELQKK